MWGLATAKLLKATRNSRNKDGTGSSLQADVTVNMVIVMQVQCVCDCSEMSVGNKCVCL